MLLVLKSVYFYKESGVWEKSMALLHFNKIKCRSCFETKNFTETVATRISQVQHVTSSKIRSY